MKKDYRGRTNWKLEDPFFVPSQHQPLLSAKQKLIGGIVILIVVIALASGLFIGISHRHKQEVAAPTIPSPPPTVNIPLQLPTHS